MSPHIPGFFLWVEKDDMLCKKLIILSLILPFLINTPVVAKSEPEIQSGHFEAKKMDQRAEILQAYLNRYDSPLKGQAQDFIDAADTYGLDWKLVPAIAGVESTFGKFIPGGYNAWGWGVYGTQAIYFDSWRDGIFTVSEGLKKNYIGRGLNDPYAINKMYSTSPAWGSHVTYFLEDMEKFEKEYPASRRHISPDLKAGIAGQSGAIALNQPQDNSFNLISLDK